MYQKKEILKQREIDLLNRIYKLDRKIETYLKNHKGRSTIEVMLHTDFINQANEIYNDMTNKLIKISLKRTKYTHNLVDLNMIIKKKEF